MKHFQIPHPGLQHILTPPSAAALCCLVNMWAILWFNVAKAGLKLKVILLTQPPGSSLSSWFKHDAGLPAQAGSLP